MNNIMKSESFVGYIIKAIIVFALSWASWTGFYAVLAEPISYMRSSYYVYQSLNGLLLFIDFVIAIAVVKKLYPAMIILYVMTIFWFAYYTVSGQGGDAMWTAICIAVYTVFGALYLILPSRKKSTKASSKKTDGTYPSNF